MTPEQLSTALGIGGAISALAISGIGSALGTGVAAASSIGAWKKCYAQKKQAPFLLLALVGAPITQTLYGMILLFPMVTKAQESASAGLALLLIGLFAGAAIGASAWLQGRAGAAAADAQAETGEGFTNYLAALGIIETVAIFVMVFSLIVVLGLK